MTAFGGATGNSLSRSKHLDRRELKVFPT